MSKLMESKIKKATDCSVALEKLVGQNQFSAACEAAKRLAQQIPEEAG